MQGSSKVGPESTVADQIRRAAVIPVVSIERLDQVEPLMGALVEAGLGCVEVTLRTDVAVEAIRRAAQIEGLTVGAGTVRTAGQVDEVAAAGADFAVAPGSSSQILQLCREHDLPFFPGVATPSEVEAAVGRGCRLLKVFPATQLGGPSFLKALAPVFPEVSFMPTGGIGPDNLADYLSLPAVHAIGGSWIAGPQLLRAGDYPRIQAEAEAAARAAQSAIEARP